MSIGITLQPLLPVWAIAALFVPAVLLLGMALLRRARGLALRALVFAALAAALLDPRLVRETRVAQPDLALVVVDTSASQDIGARRKQADDGLRQLEQALSRIAGLEVRVIRSDGGGKGETALFAPIEQAVRDDVGGRLAAVFVISDGQVHDVPPPPAPAWLGAPLHLLLTGAPGEFDRRLSTEHAPAYGLVGSRIDVGYRIDDLGPDDAVRRAATGMPVPVRAWVDGRPAGESAAMPGQSGRIGVDITHPGTTVVELQADPLPGEVSPLNNRVTVIVNGVRERLRVLLVSGQPHPGERTWRNLLKSDPGVDLVHFTILRPPEKDDATPLRELSLIVFPVQELFEDKLDEFDLVIFDRYLVRGILPTAYYARIADYVRHGGALLLAAGPEFAGSGSVGRTALGDILPVAPSGRVIEHSFRPQVTATGARHPISAGLPGAPPTGVAARDVGAAPAAAASSEATPAWGPWYRIVDGTARRGLTLLEDDAGRPLLIVDRQGDGRVAQLMSDHIWLWARGYQGGGPQNELLRRLSHWLTKEPELEEEQLQASIADGRLRVERRSVEGPAAVPVTVTDPAGATRTLELAGGGDGIAHGELAAPGRGVWRVEDGTRVALAAAGVANPPEFHDLRAAPDRLAALVEASRGGSAWLAEGLPELRRVGRDRVAAGRGWLGLRSNQASTLTGVNEVPLLPALLVLAATLGLLAGAWWREGR